MKKKLDYVWRALFEKADEYKMHSRKTVTQDD